MRLCEEKGIDLPDLTPADLAAVDARLTPDVRACLTPEAALAARTGYGGTAPARVREQIARLDATLATSRRGSADEPARTAKEIAMTLKDAGS